MKNNSNEVVLYEGNTLLTLDCQVETVQEWFGLIRHDEISSIFGLYGILSNVLFVSSKYFLIVYMHSVRHEYVEYHPINLSNKDFNCKNSI